MKDLKDPGTLGPSGREDARPDLSPGIERREFLGKAGKLAGGLFVARYMSILSPLDSEAVHRSRNGFTPATFDLISLFPEQMLAPPAGKTKTFLNIDVRNISDGDSEVSLSVQGESRYFKAAVKPTTVKPKGKDGVAKAKVDISCLPGTPEGTDGWFKVTGKRGSETHRYWLKVTALSSSPELKIPRGLNLGDLDGQGYADPVLQPYTGKPLTWTVVATNKGGAADTYRLSHEADFPCDVTFREKNGKKVTSVKRPARTRNLMFAKPLSLKAEVIPRVELPKNQPREVRLIMGPGKYTRDRSEAVVQVMNPGMLFCLNDLAGAKPNAHQVMAGQTTSFMLHVSNLDKSKADITVKAFEATGGWNVSLEGGSIKSLKPGQTARAVLKATPPSTAPVGDRIELEVTAESSTGRKDSVRVAAEVTDKRKVYFFSVDSMDPGYLYMDRKGTGMGKEGDWLMPNVRAFLKDATNYKNALVYLPSATDMNHTNALAGTYSGTSGIYSVGATLTSFGTHGDINIGPNTMDLMVYGPDGQQVERLYEVAKRYTDGKAVCGFWSNKNWLVELEAGRTLDIYGHSEHWPLFFKPPYKYAAAGDPPTDKDPRDRLSGSFTSCFHSNNVRAVMIPALLGQFDVIAGARLLATPISLALGKMPGTHAEDRYIYESFERSVIEEDPDVAYLNLADLDNTGHFTGASSTMTFDEWKSTGTGKADDDYNKFSPWMRREESLDIIREVDVLFADFVNLLKDRGVYDNCVIVFLSDHGMDNLKDPKRGYEFLDIRKILRENGFVYREDYFEFGVAEMNCVWCGDKDKLARIQRILADYTVDDKELGKVKPLILVNQQQMKDGLDLGKEGKIRPGELYSEYWITHTDIKDGTVWPDLYITPRHNYQVVAHGDIFRLMNAVGFKFDMNIPETVALAFPASHGGLRTTAIPLMLKVPAGNAGYRPGTEYAGEVEIGDIAPTIYQIMGWSAPGCVDGKPLPGGV